jgi:hypothetical protein
VEERAQEVLRRLAEMEPMERGEVLALRPDEGYLEVRRRDRVARLHLPEDPLLALLDDVETLRAVWGDGVPDVDGAARLVSVHLDESLATRAAHPTGWWTYRLGGFDPVPPWEAHRTLRDADAT